MNVYCLIMIVRDDNTVDGKDIEQFDNISLHDYEEIYLHEQREVLGVTLMYKGELQSDGTLVNKRYTRIKKRESGSRKLPGFGTKRSS